MNHAAQTDMFLDNLFDSLLVKVLLEVLLQEELHRGTSAKFWTLGVLGDGECTTGGRLPDVLLVIIVLGGDLHSFGNQVRRVETDTELTYMALELDSRLRVLYLPIMEISAPEDRASMKALVPDLAIVPRLLTKSALVIPIPVSLIVRVPSSLFGVIRMYRSFSESS